MTDQELLELAAKAAGMEVRAAIVLADGTLKGLNVVDNGTLIHYWHPLLDDGDAFRLAVKLAMFNGAMMFHFRSLERFGNPQASELECTRRAIVRTAADAGETM